MVRAGRGLWMVAARDPALGCATWGLMPSRGG